MIFAATSITPARQDMSRDTDAGRIDTAPARGVPALERMTTPYLATLHAGQLPAAVDLSKALNWPYREADWRFALSLGNGFAMQHDGRLVGTALWWAFGTMHASFGMIIVAAEMQGRGLGRELTGALLRAAADRTVILSSTAEGLGLYRQLGFVECGEICQHQAVLRAAPALPETASVMVRPMHADDFQAVRRLDALASGMDRSALLEALRDAGEIVVRECRGQLQGYACIRAFGHGTVIGPVVAEDPADAKALIAALASRCKGRFVRVDVPALSGLSPWLTGLGLPMVGDAVAMRRGAPPTSGDVRMFALSNQSLG